VTFVVSTWAIFLEVSGYLVAAISIPVFIGVLAFERGLHKANGKNFEKGSKTGNLMAVVLSVPLLGLLLWILISIFLK
jgi:uncharacterized membrane protein YraQ (UPF0718 family)